MTPRRPPVPLCNDCAFYRSRFPGYCVVSGAAERCSSQRTYVGQHIHTHFCTHLGDYFTPKQEPAIGYFRAEDA